MEKKFFTSDSTTDGFKLYGQTSLLKIRKPKIIIKNNDILSNFNGNKITYNFESCYDLRKNSKLKKEKVSLINETNLKLQTVIQTSEKEEDESEDRFFMTNSNFYKSKNNLNKKFSFKKFKFANSNLKEIIKTISITKRKIENESKEIQNMLLFTQTAKDNYEKILKNNNINNLSLPKIGR